MRHLGLQRVSRCHATPPQLATSSPPTAVRLVERDFSPVAPNGWGRLHEHVCTGFGIFVYVLEATLGA